MSSALERCVGDVARFVDLTWSRGPVHYVGTDPAGFADLLSLDDVDQIISSTALRLPAFRLIKDGVTLPESSYTKTGRAGSKPMAGIADSARIFRLFDQGATIVLQGMHRFWLPLARFCRDLELALGHPTQVNAYITPPGSRGLAVHEDSHDVFVLQSFGSKHWEVWDTRHPAGDDRDAKAAVAAAAAEPPAISAELRPGDVIYMPRRTPHAARTQQTLSGHLTIGIPATRWRQLVDGVVQRALDTAGLDEPLPAAYHRDPDGLARELDGRLAEVQRGLDKADPREAAGQAIERFLTTRPSLLRGGLVDLARLAELDERTLLRRREGAACELLLRDGGLTVLLGDRALRMPARCEPAMRAIAQADAFSPSDLEPHLDPEGRLVLVRRLVREGLLEVVGAD
jgi:cupin superfamily protein